MRISRPTLAITKDMSVEDLGENLQLVLQEIYKNLERLQPASSSLSDPSQGTGGTRQKVFMGMGESDDA